jgi:hypothetical protein
LWRQHGLRHTEAAHVLHFREPFQRGCTWIARFTRVGLAGQVAWAKTRVVVGGSDEPVELVL